MLDDKDEKEVKLCHKNTEIQKYKNKFNLRWNAMLMSG